MKTIETVVCEKHSSDMELPERKRIGDKCFIDWANFGAREAQRWISIEEETPDAYVQGDWDGKRSDFVLAKDVHGNLFVARTYEGFMDGTIFLDFVDANDIVLSNIIEWRPINRR